VGKATTDGGNKKKGFRGTCHDSQEVEGEVMGKQRRLGGRWVSRPRTNPHCQDTYRPLIEEGLSPKKKKGRNKPEFPIIRGGKKKQG